MTKPLTYFLFIISAALFVSQIAHAETYKYSDLELKSYDELSVIITARIKKASKIDLQNQKSAAKKHEESYDESESLELLKDALRMILSRPNKDNMVEKLLPDVRRELNNYGAFYDTLNDISVEAVSGINQKIPVVYRSTFVFVLENILSEFRPELKTKAEIKKIYKFISDAKIQIPEDVRLDRKLRSMFSSDSPSETAQKIIDTDLAEKKPKKSFWQRLFGG